VIVPSTSRALPTSPEAEPVDAAIIASLHQLDDGGPPIIFSELVDLFIDSVPKLLSQAWREIDDPAQLTMIAHSLKGSCSNFGAHGMEALCFQLEQLAPQRENEPARAIIAAIEQEFFRVRKALKTHCG
jgi:HPt (histidine-containing phosphotransfer) domain-containing protein